MINREKIGEIYSSLKDKSKDLIDGLKNKLGLASKPSLSGEKKLKLGLATTAVALVVFAGYTKTIAYDIHIGKESLGLVRTEAELETALEDLRTELCTSYDMDLVLADDLELKRVHVMDDSLTAAEDLKKNIKDRISFLAKGYSLEIDGQLIGALRTEEEMDQVIESIKKPYVEEAGQAGEVQEVKLLEKVVVKKQDIPLYKMTDKDHLIQSVREGGTDIKTHTVEVGETLWTIAKIYDTTMDDLIEANQDKNPDNLQIGDEIKLIKTKPLLTVATVVDTTYDQDIKYDSEVEFNDSMYDNEKTVKVEGKPGKAKIVAKEVKHNGSLISKDIVKEEVVEEPITELLVKGTKEVPKTRATGSLAMATRGRISSRYGMRNGRMHKGLDIAASIGTSITASDGGRVVSAGWSGAYGNLVEVDHENGYRTKYAHCSKILVKPGDRVYKGQEIAKVGNTGRSTGPHLHIEVLKNGRNVNPINYLK